MEKVNYLKKGEVYVFIQDFSEKREPTIIVYNENPLASFDFLNNKFDKPLSGGYITRDRDNKIHVWNSDNLEFELDRNHLERYVEIKKSKFSNLSFV
jgi:hypothetical protein